MKKALLTATFLLVSSVAYAQNPNLNCDATATNCTIKKNGTFQVTADLYTDPLAQKMRLYVDGVKVLEQPVNVTVPPVFTLSLTTLGAHTLFMEAVGTCKDVNNVDVECATASLNTISGTVVTGNPKAPVNMKFIK